MSIRTPMNVLIVEDDVLLATELGFLVEEAGCRQVGHAMSSDEALALTGALHPDLVLVDVHLSDGPTGIEVTREIVDHRDAAALFMTANVLRLPADFAGACGVIGKPYSEHVVRAALRYLETALRTGAASSLPPVGLQLAPAWAVRWGLADMPLSA